MGARVFVLAMDPSSREANRAARWCLATLVRPEDEVHVLVVRFAGLQGRSVAPIASSAKQDGLACLANTKAVHAVLHLAEDSKASRCHGLGRLSREAPAHRPGQQCCRCLRSSSRQRWPVLGRAPKVTSPLRLVP